MDPAFGGPPRVVRAYCAGMAARGHRVGIWTDDPIHTSAATEFMAERLTSLPAVYDRASFLSFAGGHFIKRLRQFDVVHIHGFWAPIGAVLTWLCRKLAIPYVLRPCGTLETWSLNQKRRKKQLALWLLGYGDMLRHSAALHLLSEQERQVLGEVPLPERIRIIPNGVHLDQLHGDDSAGRRQLRRELPWLGSEPSVLFLSRLHYKKGLDILAKAFERVAAKHPTVHLVAVGPDEGARDDFEQAVNYAGLADRVHLMGSRYGQQRRALYRVADAFCLPSRQEGLSNAILEALAAGLPTVITQQCHFPDVAEYNAGVVTELTAEAVANGLLTVFEDPERAQQMSVQARALIERKYRWETVVDAVLALYEEILDSPSSERHRR